MHTPTKKEHIAFCQAVATGETQKDAYKKTAAIKNENGDYVATDATMKNNAYKLAIQYADYIDSLRAAALKAVEQVNSSAAAAAALDGLLTHAEILRMLSDGAKGKLPISKMVVIDGKPKNVKTLPEFKDRLACLDRYLEISGIHEQSLKLKISGDLNLNVQQVTVELSNAVPMPITNEADLIE